LNILSLEANGENIILEHHFPDYRNLFLQLHTSINGKITPLAKQYTLLIKKHDFLINNFEEVN
jgi:hypothetical protein